MVKKILLKKSKLVGPKKVFLPKFGIHMNYYEREATATAAILTNTNDSNSSNTNRNQKQKQHQHQPTILFCHGIAGNALDFDLLIASMDIPPHIRILCPDQIGHGEDLKRAFSDPDNFKQPTFDSMLESTCDFLDLVKAGPNCNAFGISMGGAVVYYLRLKRPDIIQRTVLVSPAIQFCVDDKFTKNILEGTNNFIDFQCRDDVKFLFRDLLSTGAYSQEEENNNRNNNNNKNVRKKKDPISKFFLESIYRDYKTNVPKGHNRAMMYSFLESFDMTNSGCLGHIDDDHNSNNNDNDNDNKESIFAAKTDIDRDSPRLVFWPEDDQICNYEKGQLYFENSMVVNNNQKGEQYCASASASATEFETVSDCGHVFHADGRMIFEIIRPRASGFLLDFSHSSAAAAVSSMTV